MKISKEILKHQQNWIWVVALFSNTTSTQNIIHYCEDLPPEDSSECY